MWWKKKSNEEINTRVFQALAKNINYKDATVLGLPGSHLDERVFSQEVHFIQDAPYLSTLVQNPNHIGCHTLGDSESYFTGTQQLEREVIQICAEDIFKAEPDTVDGYVSAGGTEANLQAIWIFRNYYQRSFGAQLHEMVLICSADSHYSMAKASNIFQVPLGVVPVDPATRKLSEEALDRAVRKWKENGVKYVMVVVNLMTTMFGSVDDVNTYLNILDRYELKSLVHIDAAYGGFYYPFAYPDQPLNFTHPAIVSITLDAHKMVQAPYGTGIFLIRKGWMDFAVTKEASYVLGEDCTLSGSRSGANAVAIWMIFAKYGFHGWSEKMMILQKRADWLEHQFQTIGKTYFRQAHSNILTFSAEGITESFAERYGLVPDNHQHPVWYKIVVMEHVTIEKMEVFLEDFYQQTLLLNV